MSAVSLKRTGRFIEHSLTLPVETALMAQNVTQAHNLPNLIFTPLIKTAQSGKLGEQLRRHN